VAKIESCARSNVSELLEDVYTKAVTGQNPLADSLCPADRHVLNGHFLFA